jgi:hypothetical protein
MTSSCHANKGHQQARGGQPEANSIGARINPKTSPPCSLVHNEQIVGEPTDGDFCQIQLPIGKPALNNVVVWGGEVLLLLAVIEQKHMNLSSVRRYTIIEHGLQIVSGYCNMGVRGRKSSCFVLLCGGGGGGGGV